MSIQFHSTRSTLPTYSTKETIRQGIAQDAGLFIDDSLGQTHYDLSQLFSQTYQDIARTVFSLLFDDFSPEELDEYIAQAYGDQWNDPHITPLHALGTSNDYVLELFHGPTCAFKDVALQILPRLMRGTQTVTDANKVLILTATSGDTGKAALAGFADVDQTAMITFYPEGKVSRIQQLQMTTQPGSNVHVCAVRGNFDDVQSAVKRIFTDQTFQATLQQTQHYMLSSANSINIGRLIPQVVYYFSAYAQLLNNGTITLGDEVEFCVPTGNFGDILAGYYAKMLGLPIKHLIVASNSNKVLFDFLVTGTYNKQRPFHQTVAPSMDILVSSNLERMLYYMSDHDTRLIQMLMNDLRKWGAFEIPETLLTRIRQLFGCGWANEDQIRQAIADCWQQYQYVIDPHTACGYFVMQQIPRNEAIPRILLSTASPYKFPRVVGQALGIDIDKQDDFACMQVLSDLTHTPVPTALQDLQHAPERFSDVIDIDEMPQYIQRIAKQW